MSVAHWQELRAVMFVPAAQTQPINLFNNIAKARQKVKYFLFMYPVSLCLFAVICVASLKNNH